MILPIRAAWVGADREQAECPVAAGSRDGGINCRTLNELRRTMSNCAEPPPTAQALKILRRSPRVKQRPDDGSVEGDHDDRPRWLVRDEHEVRDRAEYREEGADIAGPGHAKEHAHSCGEHQDP